MSRLRVNEIAEFTAGGGVSIGGARFRDGPWCDVTHRDFGASASATASFNNGAIADAVTAMGEAGGGVVFIPAIRLPISGAAITLEDGVEIWGAGRETELHITGTLTDSRLIYAAGTEGSKTSLDANVDAGALSVVLPTGEGSAFSAGDYIALECTTIVYGSAGRTREIRKVLSVSTDTVNLDASLAFPYTTAASAQFSKITPVRGVGVRKLAIMNSAPLTNTGYAVRFRYCAEPVVESLALVNAGGGVLLHEAFDAHVNGLTVDRLPNYDSAFGYGLTFAGSCYRGTVDGLRGGGCRHLFTALSDERTGSVFWGGPQFITVNGAVGTGDDDSLSIFDTHEYGWMIVFNGCQAFGGGAACSGYQVRSRHTKLIGCTSMRAGLRGVSVASTAQDTQIIGGEYAYAVTNGLSMNGTRTRAVGAEIHHNGTTGATFASGAVSPALESCNLYDNGRLSANAAVQDQGATAPRITGCNIPFASGTQVFSIQDLAATGIASGNLLTGYGNAGTGMTGTTAGAKVVNNVGTLDGVSADRGNGDATLIVGRDYPVQIFATTLTADRAITLSTGGGAANGATWRIVRSAGGAFNLNVGTGPLIALAASEWCEVAFNGTAWVLTASGSL